MRELDVYGWVALILVIIGGICWALVGIFNSYIVTAIFGIALGRIIYIIIGIGAIYLCYLLYQAKVNKTV